MRRAESFAPDAGESIIVGRADNVHAPENLGYSKRVISDLARTI